MLTPGWFGLDVKADSGNDITMSMSIFYARVCIHGAVDICTTQSITEAGAQHNAATRVSERWTELTVEAVGCLIGVIIGGIMTLIFASYVGNRQQTAPTNGVGITALIFKIIGDICGGVLAIEFIIAHANFDMVADQVDLTSLVVKSVPYSLIVMSLGLFLELITIVIHIVTLQKYNRHPLALGMVLTPSVYAQGTVIVQSTSTTSTTPYARFA